MARSHSSSSAGVGGENEKQKTFEQNVANLRIKGKKKRDRGNDEINSY